MNEMTPTLTLIIENRKCINCGHTHEVPNPNLMLTWANGHTSRLIRERWRGPIQSLPRDVHHMDTTCDFCQHCFTSAAPNGQIEAFDDHLPKPPRGLFPMQSNLPKQRKPAPLPKMLNLEDF